MNVLHPAPLSSLPLAGGVGRVTGVKKGPPLTSPASGRGTSARVTRTNRFLARIGFSP
jgi:hypothetical protein